MSFNNIDRDFHRDLIGTSIGTGTSLPLEGETVRPGRHS